MRIIQDFIPTGRKNRPAKANYCQYITVHNTGNTAKGSGAKNHANYLKSDAAANAPVSWHYTVDDADVYQHLPDTEMGYHAGDGANGTGNTKSIGVEVCMNSDGDILKATNNATELVAELCKRRNISVENIVQHNKWTGKNCPQLIRAGTPYNWEAFIDKVKNILSVVLPPQTSPPASSITYRVRRLANDSATQIGAYSALDNAKKAANERMVDGYKVFDMSGELVFDPSAANGQDTSVDNTDAHSISAFMYKEKADAAAEILEMVRSNAIIVGLFPSVKAAQLILESDYLKSELAQNANNGFGMKNMLSGNSWPNSVWDGVSIYTKETAENKPDSTPYTIMADFRSYDRIEDSIADHSAYLLGAKIGNSLRYAGITEATDYKAQITIIKDGGYATDVSYVSKICDVIAKYSLDKYDSEVRATQKVITIEETVDNAIADGVLADRTYWLGIFSSIIKPNPEHIKTVFDRYHEKTVSKQ